MRRGFAPYTISAWRSNAPKYPGMLAANFATRMNWQEPTGFLPAGAARKLWRLSHCPLAVAAERRWPRCNKQRPQSIARLMPEHSPHRMIPLSGIRYIRGITAPSQRLDQSRATRGTRNNFDSRSKANGSWRGAWVRARTICSNGVALGGQSLLLVEIVFFQEFRPEILWRSEDVRPSLWRKVHYSMLSFGYRSSLMFFSSGVRGQLDESRVE